MAFTDEEEVRVALIESTLNQILTWLGNLPSREVWRQLNLNNQQTLSNLETRLTLLESQISTLVSRLDNLG